ncbi:MAG: LacI family transcriptional regulator [Anaerolineaceae bacterium]|nr:LacI family transcriptional regulator [Anaerolineaceae bacterium]
MKRPTQVDVAKRAGVSRATVSYVVNGLANGRVPISEETRQRVLEAVAELGYMPDARAQALRSGSTRTIGAIIPDIRNPHFWEYANGIEQEARAHGYRIILSSTSLSQEYEDDTLQDLAQRRIDGLILQGSFTTQTKKVNNTLSQLIKRQLPIVKIGEPTENIDSVWSDYRTVTQEIMTYLLSLEHRRIGLIYGVAPPILAEDRLVPYRECLQAAGVPVDPELIAQCGPTIEDAYQAALQLLLLPSRPTALIAINDMLAVGVLRTAADLGLQVPTDLSLVSYDNIPMANYLVPRLTTVSKDAVKFGQEAVRLLLARIEQPNRPVQRVDMPIRLIVRESTGPAPVLMTQGGDDG